MDLSKLKEPFPADQIEWRIGQAGKSAQGIWGTCLAYVQARAVMERLDDVCGPVNWTPEYQFVGTTGVICTLSIRCDNAWIHKSDGAEMTDIEAFKGGISDAFKRAAVTWGISRYLYDLESGFIKVVDKNTRGAKYGRLPEKLGGDTFYWLPPELPSWALPKNSEQPKIAPPISQVTGAVQSGPALPTGSVPSQIPTIVEMPGRDKGRSYATISKDEAMESIRYWEARLKSDGKPASGKLVGHLAALYARLEPRQNLAPIVPTAAPVAPSTLFDPPLPAWVTENVPVSQQPIWNPDELKE